MIISHPTSLNDEKGVIDIFLAKLVWSLPRSGVFAVKITRQDNLVSVLTQTINTLFRVVTVRTVKSDCLIATVNCSLSVILVR